MKYRAEIDGLRALAVIPVILFHAGFELFNGGYVGVDVFFVISGYLITTILIEDIEKKRFSIANFYERRALRILPALFFVMLVCIPFAWMWMLPSQMIDFSQSLIAVSLFASNILFWRDSGYFDAVAEEKPLLHTWSLGIEEQYYVLFPIFLIVAWRFGKNKVILMIVLMAAISLLTSEWGWRNKASANFYLFPSRAWELFAGSITAFVVQKRGVQKNDLLALFGLSAIMFSIFFYDESTPIPSLYALVPVVGVVLLILYAGKETLAAQILSMRVFVSIGLISYSAYLWHQPLFAFARIRLLAPPTETSMLILSLMSVALGYLSWKYIEKPFRVKDNYGGKKILICAFVGILSFASIGTVGLITDGFLERFSSAEQKLIGSAASSPLRSQCHFPKKVSSLELTGCSYFSDDTSIAVFGNSHATELAYALAIGLQSSGEGVLHHTISDCKHNYRKSDEAQSICYKWHEKTVDSLVADNSINTVVLSYRNEHYLENSSYRESLVKIAATLDSSNKRVILVLQAPLAGAHVNHHLNLSMISKMPDVEGLSKLDWDSIYSAQDELLKELPRKVIVVDPKELLCDESSCYAIKDNKAMYFDDNHLSIEGAGIVARHLLNTYFLK